ncbi:hypothetical protein B0H17DRAFT_1223157 [Mycena rosella]|uniref:Uncharacterized protein n=1 Tax=Mycena rosella TaxID=1033263 RepID=A0AAD7AWF2_MYCRO|nr:hypothetical protein B0H17DRAFT_1223157 [Mycena rosella]
MQRERECGPGGRSRCRWRRKTRLGLAAASRGLSSSGSGSVLKLGGGSKKGKLDGATRARALFSLSPVFFCDEAHSCVFMRRFYTFLHAFPAFVMLLPTVFRTSPVSLARPSPFSFSLLPLHSPAYTRK